MSHSELSRFNEEQIIAHLKQRVFPVCPGTLANGSCGDDRVQARQSSTRPYRRFGSNAGQLMAAKRIFTDVPANQLVEGLFIAGQKINRGLPFIPNWHAGKKFDNCGHIVKALAFSDEYLIAKDHVHEVMEVAHGVFNNTPYEGAHILGAVAIVNSVDNLFSLHSEGIVLRGDKQPGVAVYHRTIDQANMIAFAETIFPYVREYYDIKTPGGAYEYMEYVDNEMTNLSVGKLFPGVPVYQVNIAINGSFTCEQVA